MYDFDIAVLGGGPAGYTAAIRAAQWGAKTCLIEAEELGGTCLNHGCIPTKTLLQHTDFLRELLRCGRHGIKIVDPAWTVNLTEMMDHKAQVVRKLVGGVASLLKSYKIEHFQGRGRIEKDLSISLNRPSSEKAEKICAKKIILAGGSESIKPPIPGIEHPAVLTSREVLQLQALPESMVIIGGGVIGLEMARIFSAFGTKITILELADRLLPFMDEELSQSVTAHFREQNISFHTGVKVDRIEPASNGLNVFVTNGDCFFAENVLISTGRRANLSAVSNLDIQQERGFVAVDSRMQTNLAEIYAPGDINGKCMLAHAAFQMADVAVANALDVEEREWSAKAIPSVLYGHPEVASVGLTEQQAQQVVQEKKSSLLVGRFPFAANGRAVSAAQDQGMVKILCDAKYGEILGVHLVGPHVSELINEAALAISAEITVHELAETVHAHPTYSEVLAEAAADALNKAVHLPAKKVAKR